MSLKKIEQVKADRGFKIWDLIIYGAIAALVIVLFAVIFTTCDTDPLKGVRITLSGNTVFEYEFGGTPVYSDCVKVEEDEYSLTVTVDCGRGDYNVLSINKYSKTAQMVKANCNGGNCVGTPLKNNSGSIQCPPHELKVEPFTEKDFNGPIII